MKSVRGFGKKRPRNILEKYQLAEEEIAYVGDDILDLPVLQGWGYQ